MSGEVAGSVDQWDRRADKASSGNCQCLFIAETHEGFAGMVGAYTPDDEPSMRHLYGMWVAPESRLAGVGQQLVEEIIRWSIEAEADAVQLWVVEGNLAARRLYSRAGFAGFGNQATVTFRPGIDRSPHATAARFDFAVLTLWARRI